MTLNSVFRAIVAASVIALAAPCAWFVALGNSYESGPVPQDYEAMSDEQKQDWKNKNLAMIPILSHIANTPRFISSLGLDYLKVSAWVFLITAPVCLVALKVERNATFFFVSYALGFKLGLQASFGASAIVAAVSTILSVALLFGLRGLLA